MTDNEFVWRKSSYSDENGECVEAALLDGRFAVRDSKAPDAGTMSVGRDGMAALLSSVKTAGRTSRHH
ncbi:DUF397 domain-containing protein [Actinophytocola gossypii]|uniref:DUF397 domain-containing protein n=1 Tax=Actinophytocola gossypii TaxID=2812003 RepID=A0ABT2JIC1_9PSEU|nr:DUF397 domain-containing protein [Actinophytocola gossypii]MCT2587624.1 DUF397 domain-containing protein [Actinophytocola gossypii]